MTLFPTIRFWTLMILSLAVVGTDAVAQTIRGPARVRDGDTIVVNRTPVRLNGLACPEMHEPGGWAAKKKMIFLTSRQFISCELNGERTHDRKVGICTDQSGTDIAIKMVSAGLCRDCPRYSNGRYGKFETALSKRLPFPKYCNDS